MDAELGALIYRLIGDASSYLKMLADVQAANPALGASMDDVQKHADSLVAKLEAQAATFGMTSRAADIHRAKLAGVSEATLAHARALDAAITAQEQHAAAMTRGADITRSVETAQERHGRRVGELGDLLRRGAISHETYGRAVAQSRSELAGVNTVLGDTSRLATMGSHAIAALGVSFAGFAILRESISRASMAERMQTDFGVMLQSAQAGRQLFADLNQFAAETPLELPQVSAAARQLLNFGVAGRDVLPMLRQLGDVAGGDNERLQRLTYSFGQMTQSGRVFGHELREMMMAGFNPLQEMARTRASVNQAVMQGAQGMGGLPAGLQRMFPTGQAAILANLQEEMHHGAISVDEVRAALDTATSAGGRFFNLMERQSQTISGLWSTLRDNVGLALQGIGEDIARIVDLRGWLRTLSDAAQMAGDVFRAIPDWIKTATTAAIGFSVGIGVLKIAWNLLLQPIFSVMGATIGGAMALVGYTRQSTVAAAAVRLQTVAIDDNTRARLTNNAIPLTGGLGGSLPNVATGGFGAAGAAGTANMVAGRAIATAPAAATFAPVTSNAPFQAVGAAAPAATFAPIAGGMAGPAATAAGVGLGARITAGIVSAASSSTAIAAISAAWGYVVHQATQSAAMNLGDTQLGPTKVTWAGQQQGQTATEQPAAPFSTLGSAGDSIRGAIGGLNAAHIENFNQAIARTRELTERANETWSGFHLEVIRQAGEMGEAERGAFLERQIETAQRAVDQYDDRIVGLQANVDSLAPSMANLWGTTNAAAATEAATRLEEVQAAAAQATAFMNQLKGMNAALPENRPANQRIRSSIDDALHESQDKANTVGMTHEEVTAYRIRNQAIKDGVDLTAEYEAKLDELVASGRVREHAEEMRKATEEATKLFDEMRIGATITANALNPDQARIYRLELEGAEEATIRAARAAEELNRASHIEQQFADPIEAYRRRVTELDGLLANNRISQGAHDRAMNSAEDHYIKAADSLSGYREEVQRTHHEVATFSAALSGSAEAITRQEHYLDMLAAGGQHRATAAERREHDRGRAREALRTAPVVTPPELNSSVPQSFESDAQRDARMAGYRATAAAAAGVGATGEYTPPPSLPGETPPTFTWSSNPEEPSSLIPRAPVAPPLSAPPPAVPSFMPGETPPTFTWSSNPEEPSSLIPPAIPPLPPAAAAPPNLPPAPAVTSTLPLSPETMSATYSVPPPVPMPISPPEPVATIDSTSASNSRPASGAGGLSGGRVESLLTQMLAEAKVANDLERERRGRTTQTAQTVTLRTADLEGA